MCRPCGVCNVFKPCVCGVLCMCVCGGGCTRHVCVWVCVCVCVCVESECAQTTKHSHTCKGGVQRKKHKLQNTVTHTRGEYSVKSTK